MTSSSHFFSRSGEPTLRYTLHLPPETPAGAVLLTHGYAEHSGRYDEVVAALTGRGLAVATHDLRGHGHSEGLRGYVERFGDYTRDARALLDHLAASEPAWAAAGRPVLIGHSLGGLITYLLALELGEAVRGVVLSSPFFGLALPVPAVKRAAGRVLSRVLPRIALPSGLHGRDLTHDARLAQAYDADPLLVQKVPARWFTEATGAQQQALERAPSWRLPLLLLHGGDDRVASVAASRAVFERIPASAPKEMHVLDGQFHEIFNELDRDRFIAMAADAAAGFIARG